jgi:hypothetical protein
MNSTFGLLRNPDSVFFKLAWCDHHTHIAIPYIFWRRPVMDNVTMISTTSWTANVMVRQIIIKCSIHSGIAMVARSYQVRLRGNQAQRHSGYAQWATAIRLQHVHWKSRRTAWGTGCVSNSETTQSLFLEYHEDSRQWLSASCRRGASRSL